MIVCLKPDQNTIKGMYKVCTLYAKYMHQVRTCRLSEHFFHLSRLGVHNNLNTKDIFLGNFLWMHMDTMGFEWDIIFGYNHGYSIWTRNLGYKCGYKFRKGYDETQSTCLYYNHDNEASKCV